MNITFELIDKHRVKIMNGNNQIGEIFTPSGTTHDTPNSIQVCGFTEMFEFWGCGVYGDGNGNAKKDIQLRFEQNSQPESIEVDLGKRVCMRCFHPYNKCECNDMIRQLIKMARSIEKHHTQDIKRLIFEGLEKSGES